jgi:nucleotide-binding universal stress UspA family protein
MDIATIMVPMGRAEASPEELELVNAFARQIGAQILGVMARELNPALYYEAGVVAGDIVEEDRKRLGEILAKAEKRFRSVIGTQHPSVEWRSSIDWPTDFALCQARSADLIVSFHRPIRVDTDLEIGTLVLKAGRPVLLLGEAGLAMPPKVLVAWKDTREARRAIRDALPILRRASTVHVIEIVEGDWSQSAANDHLKDVVAWLAAHDIKATSATHGSTANVTEEVDAAARELGADLIVAGGYGHTRLGEWVFGGMTHHLISECGRSVLLSH